MRAFLLTLSGIYTFIVSSISGICFAFSIDYLRGGEEWLFLSQEMPLSQNRVIFIAVFSALVPILIMTINALTYKFITGKIKKSELEVEKIKLPHYLIVNGSVYVAIMTFCLLLGTSG